MTMRYVFESAPQLLILILGMSGRFPDANADTISENSDVKCSENKDQG